ncbi:protein-(glutamine-N5) methyltransferase, release factor-specific [[Limnothrix rosea] IAM M-220]|nr:protein-(glutamine-N5) methyltransferase, release factor-specific [[Limnothrix rosea] IAM M-220]
MILIAATALSQWREWAQAQAIAADISLGEINWFLQALTSITALDLKLGINRDVHSQVSLTELKNLWQQRVEQRVPVQYLVGKTPWRNFELIVTPSVLIPRPETEYLIDLALEATDQNPALATGHWVDLGTGSGAIALSLVEQFPNATIHAVDRSAAALDIARKNAKAYGMSDQIQFYQGSWWEPLQEMQGKMSAMLANPPYIPSDLLPDLQTEVFCHEPHSALDGGEDGLSDIRILVSEAPNFLISGGIWLIELMKGQGQVVAQLLSQNGNYNNIQVVDDFSGCDRYVLAKRR